MTKREQEDDEQQKKRDEQEDGEQGEDEEDRQADQGGLAAGSEHVASCAAGVTGASITSRAPGLNGESFRS